LILKLFLLCVSLLLVGCGSWGTVTGEMARESIDLHEVDLAPLPEKEVFKTIEEDKNEGGSLQEERMH
jgi:hypothetical protein